MVCTVGKKCATACVLKMVVAVWNIVVFRKSDHRWLPSILIEALVHCGSMKEERLRNQRICAVHHFVRSLFWSSKLRKMQTPTAPVVYCIWQTRGPMRETLFQPPDILPFSVELASQRVGGLSSRLLILATSLYLSRILLIFIGRCLSPGRFAFGQWVYQLVLKIPRAFTISGFHYCSKITKNLNKIEGLKNHKCRRTGERKINWLKSLKAKIFTIGKLLNPEWKRISCGVEEASDYVQFVELILPFYFSKFIVGIFHNAPSWVGFIIWICLGSTKPPVVHSEIKYFFLLLIRVVSIGDYRMIQLFKKIDKVLWTFWSSEEFWNVGRNSAVNSGGRRSLRWLRLSPARESVIHPWWMMHFSFMGRLSHGADPGLNGHACAVCITRIFMKVVAQ